MPRIFAEPDWLWLLVLLGLVGLVVARGSSRRRAEWAALGHIDAPPSSGIGAWWLVALGGILALAAPRWGREPGSEPLPGHDVVFLVDVSRSMGAEDAVPDRLRLATGAARSLVEQLRAEPGDRAAVVAFAGRAVIRCPLTDNLDAVRESLADLRPGSIDPSGTDLGAGLAVAAAVFDGSEHAEGRSIVLFSDGEDHAATWPEIIGLLVAAGIPVHAVAVGDPGKPVPVPLIAGRPGDPASSPPMTRRSDKALTQLAYATGGASIPLGLASTDLGTLYRDAIRPTAQARRSVPRFSERAERYGVVLAGSLGASIWGAWPRSRRWRYRASLGAPGGMVPWERLLVVALIALMLALASLAATPMTPESVAEGATNRGRQAYAAARFAAGLAEFEAAIAASPANPIGPFDAGAALFALERYPEATLRYDQARELARSVGNRSLLAKVDYALGNCLAMMGDFAGAVAHYDDCLMATDRQPALGLVRRDAWLNRAFALARIEPPDASEPGDAPAPDSPGGPNDPSPGDRNPRGSESDPAGDSRSAAAGANGADSRSSGQRGAGGAGGSGAALPEPDSPTGRLEAALRRIKAAKEKRPDDPPPRPRPLSPDGSGKDW